MTNVLRSSVLAIAIFSTAVTLNFGLASTAHGVPLMPGDILTVDGITGDVIRVDPVTGSWETFASGGFLTGGTHDIAVGSDGAIFVASDTQVTPGEPGALVRIDPVTGDQTLLVGVPGFQPARLTIGEGGDIFLIENLSQNVVRVDSDTGAILDTYSGGFLSTGGGTQGIAATSTGMLIVTNTNLGTVFTLDPTSGSQNAILSVVADGVAVDGSDRIILLNDSNNTEILRAELTGSVLDTFDKNPFSSGQFVAVDLAGNYVFNDFGLAGTAEARSRIGRLDPATGVVEMLAVGPLNNSVGGPSSWEGVAVFITPEPSTAALLALGLVGIATGRRRTAARAQWRPFFSANRTCGTAQGGDAGGR